MDRQNLTAALCHNSIFQGLTPEQLGSVLPCLVHEEKRYGQEECVYDKGQPVQHLGVVLDGVLRICDENADGRRTTVAHIGRNELFGEAVVFSSSRRVPHRVIASRETRVLFLSGNFFLSTCGQNCAHRHAHQNIIRNMLRLLSDRALLLNKKIAYLTAPDLKSKIAMYLCELYDLNKSLTFTMPMNRDSLADFFAVARPSLSRELVNLKRMGVIDFYRSSVKILNLPALCALAHGEER